MKLVTSVAIAIVTAFSAHAATLTVANTADAGAGSLRATVAAAGAGDTIQFDPSLNGQTITLTSGEIALSKNLAITGPGASNLSISGNNSSRVFNVTATDSISGLTFTSAPGAITSTGPGLTVTSCAFTANNSVPEFGAGGAIENYGPAQFTGCTMSGNAASVGGAIFNGRGGAMTLTDCSFSSNTSDAGGAIFSSEGTLSVTRCQFTGNVVPGDGIAGALYNDNIVDITDSTFSGNTCGDGGEGGAIFTDAYPPNFHFTIRNSTISGNSIGATTRNSDAQGGAIWNDGVLNIVNSTIANNISGGSSQGAGIYNTDARGHVNLDDSTVSGNTAGASSSGGGIFNDDGHHSVINPANTIIARNTAPTSPDILGTLTSRGYNLIGDTTGNMGEVASDLINIDPQLGPLQNNGGSTLTMALSGSSPAIDAGDPAFDPNTFTPPMLTDQRGSPRVGNGRVDIGAYEATAAHHPTIDSLTAPQTVECASHQGTSASINVHVSDTMGHALTIQWIVNNQVKQTDQIAAQQPTTSGSATYTAVFPDGTTNVTVSVSDGQGTPVMQSTSVTVQDTTPPTITAISASPNTLSPPNHKMVPVTISVTVTDICDPAPTAKIISVSSNEPGAGEYQITGPLSVNIQSERNGGGNGRVYTITVQASDDSGNTSNRSVTVTVPKGGK
jgi:hypothetical protein